MIGAVSSVVDDGASRSEGGEPSLARDVVPGAFPEFVAVSLVVVTPSASAKAVHGSTDSRKRVSVGGAVIGPNDHCPPLPARQPDETLVVQRAQPARRLYERRDPKPPLLGRSTAICPSQVLSQVANNSCRSASHCTSITDVRPVPAVATTDVLLVVGEQHEEQLRSLLDADHEQPSVVRREVRRAIDGTAAIAQTRRDEGVIGDPGETLDAGVRRADGKQIVETPFDRGAERPSPVAS